MEGKVVSTIDSLLTDKRQEAKIVMIFNFFDCSSCVDASFALTNLIDSKSSRNTVTVIGSMIRPNIVQERNKYFEYIYADDKDLIRRELKFLPTPVVLVLDKNNIVHTAYMPRDTIDIDRAAANILQEFEKFRK